MNKILYIFLVMAVALVDGCKEYDIPTVESEDAEITSVELTEDGQMRVTGRMRNIAMGEVSVSSRAATENVETVIRTGWCILFSEDAVEVTKPETNTYTKASPLLIRKKLTINGNGTFFVTLPYYSGVAFLRIVTNLTERETESIEAAKAWGDDEANYTDIADKRWLNSLTSSDDMAGLSTFGDYEHQSVGLDGIYDFSELDPPGYKYSTTVNEGECETTNGVENFVYGNINEVSPDPTKLAKQFPMSSSGFELADGINAESLQKIFNENIFLERVCSYVDVTVSDSGFTLKEVYIIDCAQEARLRKSVLPESASESEYDITVESFKLLPYNLGGAINYLPLKEVRTTGQTTSPIYFFPNSGSNNATGGDYNSNGGAVDQGVNPQYVIIKGRAYGYDTDGYYKVALKAQYVLDKSGTLSPLTYNILRNVHFNINLKMVDKPGYKTLEDAKDVTNPANNISYNITTSSEDSRNEILVGKGASFTELHTTRVYINGYEGAAKAGSISFNITPNTAGDVTPATYIMGDYGVTITGVDQDGDPIAITKDGLFEGDEDYVHNYWFKLAKKKGTKTKVTVYFEANDAGRIRLRIGDMIKFIPVYYDYDPFDGEAQKVEFNFDDKSVFSYEDDDDITYLDGTTNEDKDGNRWFTYDGNITENNDGADREMAAMIYPITADGVAKLYFKQLKKVVVAKDPDAPDPGKSDVLTDGNIIHLEGVLIGHTPSGSEIIEKFDDEKHIAETIVDMINNGGYNTIHFDGQGNYDIEAILDEVAKLTKGDKDFTYGLNLDNYTGNDFNGDYKGEIFDEKSQITALTIPASKLKKICQETLEECTNLRTLTIGTPSAPATEDMDKIETTALEDCKKLELILVYSKKNTVTVEGQENTIYFEDTNESKNSTNANTVLTSTSAGNCATKRYTLTGPGASGYLHIFYGNVDDIVDENGRLLSKYYTVTAD